MSELEFHDDPAAFLAAAGAYLAAHPVTASVVAMFTNNILAQRRSGRPRPPGPQWWVVARDGAEVLGVGMRTAPSPPYALFLLPLPAGTGAKLARVLHERGDLTVDGHCAVNGAAATGTEFAREAAGLTGGTVRVAIRTRLHELTDLAALERSLAASAPAGEFAPAGAADADLVRQWLGAFQAAADQQAGRAPHAHDAAVDEHGEIVRRVGEGEFWLWRDPAGEPVHLSAARSASGVARIGPVYTPDQHRGRRYASATVARLSKQLVAQGLRVCLFTDQANPTSNAVYARVGFTPTVDMLNLVVQAPVDQPSEHA